MENTKRKKHAKIIPAFAIVLVVSVCIGLIVTGYTIGWGPFQELRYHNYVCYDIGYQQYSYTCERKVLQGPNGKIVGHLYMTDTGKENPLIILSHGRYTEQWWNINTAVTLASSGLNVFMFDYCGGSIHCKSDGSMKDMSIVTEMGDLNAVIDEVKTWDNIDSDRIGIIGYSLGGRVAMLTAASRDDIYKMCIMYSGLGMLDEIKKQYTSVDEIPYEEGSKSTVGSKFILDIYTFDDGGNIFEYAAQYTNPVLLMHGTADQSLPYTDSIIMDSYYQNSELILFEGADHGFEGEDEKRSIQYQYEFFVGDK
ncbi:MAG: alpha/beta hydrolase family protein [Faecousia sp.]